MQPTNLASVSRAASRCVSKSRAKNCSGCRSMRERHSP